MSETVPLYLLGIGPQRTGTTWLDRQLRRHPDLAFPQHVKETFFFDRHWSRGLPDYRAHFPTEATRWAELAPTLFDHPEAPEHVASAAPDARILVTLRDPVARAISLWRHHQSKGRVGDDLWRAAERIPSILTAGDYADHLPRWTESVGPERVLVLLTDDLRTRPQETLDRITDFVDLSPLPASVDAREAINRAGAPRFPVLARTAARAVTALRDARLHRVVTVGKRFGLARVYRGGTIATVTEADRARLAERYASHVAFVDAHLGRPTGWAR